MRQAIHYKFWVYGQTNTTLSKFWSQCGAAYVMCKCTTGTIRTVCVDINYRQTYNEIPYHYYDILSDDHVANKLLYSLLIQKFFHFFSCPQCLIRLLSWTNILFCRFRIHPCHYKTFTTYSYYQICWYILFDWYINGE